MEAVDVRKPTGLLGRRQIVDAALEVLIGPGEIVELAAKRFIRDEELRIPPLKLIMLPHEILVLRGQLLRVLCMLGCGGAQHPLPFGPL